MISLLSSFLTHHHAAPTDILNTLMLSSQDMSAQKCFIEALNKTQSCDNPDILYVTNMGTSSGLGSEFNAYLIRSLLTAVSSKRRMVYFKSKRNWEYDCDSKSGWACYLQFRCSESGVNSSELDYSQKYVFKDATSLQISNMTWLQLLSSRHHSIHQTINTFSVQGKNCSVNLESLSVTILTSMAAKYLFHLNTETKSYIKHINSRYKNLARSPYLSLQLRMTDKKYEMSKEAWQWVNNLSNTAEFIKPYFKEAHTNSLFVGMQN